MSYESNKSLVELIRVLTNLKRFDMDEHQFYTGSETVTTMGPTPEGDWVDYYELEAVLLNYTKELREN